VYHGEDLGDEVRFNENQNKMEVVDKNVQENLDMLRDAKLIT